MKNLSESDQIFKQLFESRNDVIDFDIDSIRQSVDNLNKRLKYITIDEISKDDSWDFYNWLVYVTDDYKDNKDPKVLREYNAVSYLFRKYHLKGGLYEEDVFLKDRYNWSLFEFIHRSIARFCGPDKIEEF